MKLKLRYIHEDVDRHGNVRVYFWKRPGPKIRIHAAPGSVAFAEAYEAALAGSQAAKAKIAPKGSLGPKRGSLHWLCAEYYQSAEWKRLGDRTRYVRRQVIDSMMIEPVEPGSALLFGDVPVTQITMRAARVLRDRKSDFPEAANVRVKALRQVFDFAIQNEIVTFNPAREVPFFKTGSEGFHTWTIEEVRQFEARHALGTKARLALAILLYTGVRRSDAVRLGRQMERGEWLHFSEVKGSARHKKDRSLPILPELRQAINAAPSSNLTYLVTEYGKPFTANGFGNWFRKRCDEAGLSNCTAHGLRKAGATIAADNGATEFELMSIFGWESAKQAAVYTKQANRRKLAGGAMRLLVPTEG